MMDRVFPRRSHILDKHIDDFNKLQGDNLANKIEGKLSEVIKNGVIEKTYNGFNVKYQNYIVGLNKGFNKTGNNNWIVTSFENSNGAIKTAYLDSITKSRLSLLNHNDIIPNKNNLIKQDMADGFKRAYANQAINNNLITSLSSAGVGASVNDEDRLKGAFVGALGALGGKYALQKGGNFVLK